ncbi:alanine racemase [Oscillospiraceae bacterium MB08-C2-2]|nr:alanine racemase [Oscillospiraceae bacterium MB08-C2-2]
MPEFLKRSWAVVNLDHLAHNVGVIREQLQPACMLMGVVKADAYGHGECYISAELERLGVNWFGVSNINEAIALREQGIEKPILIFGATPPEHAGALSRHSITQAVYSLEYAGLLQAAAADAGVTLQMHIKVDTGMSRLGFVAAEDKWEQTVEDITKACRLPNLRAQGIFTHFASADELDEDGAGYTSRQFEAFEQIILQLSERGILFELHHCCNSAGVMNYPHMHMDMVRPGILLYGLLPSGDCAGKLDIKPVMELYSSVSMVKEIPENTAVSYGRIYHSHRPTRVATVAIGYADGYERALSNKSRMLVRGQYANVIGRVCMDQLMLDVTHIPEVSAGDLVTIVGQDGENTLTFDEMAELCGTVNYEKVCLLGRRVPRVYRRNGKDIVVVDYSRIPVK